MFVKGKKVAGTSLEAFISPFLSETAIVTPISERTVFGSIRMFEEDHEENWRVSGDKPRNFQGSLVEESGRWLWAMAHYGKLQSFNRLRSSSLRDKVKPKIQTRFYDHMPASQALERMRKYHSVDRSIITVIGVVREPVDQAISDFYDCVCRPESMDVESFEQYLEKRAPIFFEKLIDKYYDSRGCLLLHEVLRFERLDQDLGYIFEKYNIAPASHVDDFRKFRIHGNYRKSVASGLHISEKQKSQIYELAGPLADFYIT